MFLEKTYKVILTSDVNDFSVYVPDFNCNTQGKDIDNSLFIARDVIGIMGDTLYDMGKHIPEPDSVNYIPKEHEIVKFVDVDFDEYHKKMCSIKLV